MRKRIFAAFVCLCMLMALVPSMAYAGDTVSVGGLCEHHTQHDSACGYSEGAAETPCGHEHTEECYTQATKCVHEHTAECYSDGNLPAEGEEKTADSCSHQCSEESGCITKELNCNHEHDENCGYIPATAGTPCTYVCEICNAPATEEDKCICETKCTEGERNDDCPVCGGEDGNISICVGAASAMLFSPMSTRSITPEQPLGDGTEEKPYQIGTAEELYWFAGLVNGTLNGVTQNTGAWAELTTDIIIPEGETWTAIGNYESESYDNDDPKFPVFQIVSYTGTFDGKGYTISNLYSYEEYGSRSGGLFGNIGAGGTVKNVGILDSVIDHLTVNSSKYWISSFCCAGGICGYNGGTIENCYSTAEVKNDYNFFSYSGLQVDIDRVGGVCGHNDGIIKNCYNTGSVSSDGNSYIGGVCGYNNGTIINCYNTGEVTGEVSDASKKLSYVGGICGYNHSTIENCYNTGEVSDASINLSYVGGICGYNNKTIENCYNTGEASNSTSNPSYVGSACGYNRDTMTNCYFLTGTAKNDIASGDGTATKVEEKGESAFSSGEVAWLLNEGQDPKPWAQGSNMLVLKDNLPENMEVNNSKQPVRITIVMPDGKSEEYGYTTKESSLAEYPSGYVFFIDDTHTQQIDIETKSYDVDTIIYAVKAVASITLNKTELSLYIGREETLTAKVIPEDAHNTTVNWASSDPKVATVDENGTVKAISRGEATITAEAADGSGVKAECTVTVRKKSSGGSIFFWDLKFDTNGGSDINTLTEWEYSTIDLDEYVPEKEGYKFVGWYADEDLTKEIDEVYLTEDTTVYAKWEKIEEEVPEEPEETEEIKEPETISFKDVKENDWFYEAVSYAVENGLMSGMSEDIFAPNTPLTREMLAVVLYNVEGQPESTEADTFTDVKGDMWYTDAILWANENGIVAGYDNSAYGVGDLITREQFATILYRYAQFKGYDTTQGGMAVREFSDYENISDYARPAMAWAVNAGIMGGMDDGTLMPQGKATRAEAATMLMNFCENMVEK